MSEHYIIESCQHCKKGRIRSIVCDSCHMPFVNADTAALHAENERLAQLAEERRNRAKDAERENERLKTQLAEVSASFSECQSNRREYGKGDAMQVAKRIWEMIDRNLGHVGIGVMEQNIAAELTEYTKARVDALTRERDAAFIDREWAIGVSENLQKICGEIRQTTFEATRETCADKVSLHMGVDPYRVCKMIRALTIADIEEGD